MDEIERRVAQLELRLREAEDRLAIYQLIATYGPAVDGLAEEVVAGLWADDGVYDPGGVETMEGSRAVGAVVNHRQHREFVARGSGHVMSLPHITITGDTAVATGYSNVFLREGDHWQVCRTSANRWELKRTADGWKVVHRLNRLLNGEEEAVAVLARAF